MQHPIKDQAGKTLAYMGDESPYRKTVRSRSGALLATFNPEEGTEGMTHDSSGRVVGSGDQRGRFIPEDD